MAGSLSSSVVVRTWSVGLLPGKAAPEKSCSRGCVTLAGKSSVNRHNLDLIQYNNTFAKIGQFERASVVELLSATTTTQNSREAPDGHFSTCTMPAPCCDGDNPASIQPHRVCHAGHDRARDDVGPFSLGWTWGQLSDRATFFLHGDPVGHAVLVVLSSASVPAIGFLPTFAR